MMGYTIRHDGRKWVAVFEFDEDDNCAIAYAFGPGDGAYDEHLRAAEELRALNESQ